MGRRKKAAKKVVKKRRPVVSKVFKCFLCNHDKCVSFKKDMNTKKGIISCSVCNAAREIEVNHLTEPIDAYTEWLDLADEEQKKLIRRGQGEDVEDDEEEINIHDNDNDNIVDDDEEEEE